MLSVVPSFADLAAAQFLYRNKNLSVKYGLIRVNCLVQKRRETTS